MLLLARTAAGAVGREAGLAASRLFHRHGAAYGNALRATSGVCIFLIGHIVCTLSPCRSPKAACHGTDFEIRPMRSFGMFGAGFC